MNADHITPPTPNRSPKCPRQVWLLVLLTLAVVLLASSAHGIAKAQGETQEISNAGGSARLQDVTITNNSENTCEFTVTKSTVPPGGTPADPGEVPLQWDITSSGCGDLHANLRFHYTDDELNAGNSVYESGLRAFRYDDPGLWVDQCTGSCVYPSDDEVRVDGVTQLGDWTIADLGDGYPGPTAVTVRGPARAVGLDESGLVLGLSVLTGMGLILGWRLRNRSA
jgi:hypothetical protein